MKPQSWWKIVEWRIVLAAALPIWLLIGGGLYLATLEREKSPIEVGSPTPPPRLSPPTPEPTEILPSPRIVREIVEAPHPPTVEISAVPRKIETGATVPVLVERLIQKIRDIQAPPEAPPVVAIKVEPANPDEAKGIPEDCKTHGTTVHFVKSPVEAFKQAATKDKLVFVVHLAGNIEDDGFT